MTESRPLVLVVQHVEVEGPGLLGHVLREAGVGIELVGPGENLPTGDLARVAGIVLLGGPMGVYDDEQYPRLRQEIALLERAVARQLPVLGICLGSQLLAAALGARVRPAPQKEVGWHDLTLTAEADADELFRGLPSKLKALHWHGDAFEVPSSARCLARSELTACQAFNVGKAWGLLFHFEAGVEEIATMARAFPEALREAQLDEETLLSESREHAGHLERFGRLVFGRWVALLRR